jgi:AraC family transcriptional regulator
MELNLNESRRVYISKICEVQDYIESHLEDELCTAQLAKVASFSEYHFQRIFKQITGESLYSYIKRLRLEKAVFFLRGNRQLAIQDIACRVGFLTQASFAKAFKERYGMSAREIRKMNDSEMSRLVNEMSTNGKVLREEIHYNIPIELTIKTIDPIEVVYLRHTGSYKGNSDLFTKLFSRLYSYASKKGLVNLRTKWFAVYHDYGDLTKEEKLRLSVCMSVESNWVSQGEFGCMEIAGGKYAVGRFSLYTDEYQSAWSYMVSKWLPESGYMPDDRLCFEYYPPQECENDSRRIVEIFIPITPL